MSGYIGNPDAESEHAMIISENGIHAARQNLIAGRVNKFCDECGEDIPQARREFFLARDQRCLHCVDCAPNHVIQTRVKMLDRIL